MNSCGDAAEPRLPDPREAGAAAVEVLGEVLGLVRPTGVRRVRIRTRQFDVDVVWERPAPSHGVAVGNGHAPGHLPTPVGQSVSVTAPAVGVFHRCPAQGEPPFVDVGSRVAAGDRLGLVEAMKVSTPVIAPHAGTVSGIHAGDGEVVEYEQLLVELVPDEAAPPRSGT
ncbi:acetyl-CoA carboxylase biotin carboxyl carrier protein [Saccharothrix tamanrassetensis]|uniref:Biotin carboxyl carrier protein of acetyl-CoA carboxylase n=1 Tax=Saccharothrix tamanrassetensis TaxID=1051531 RepID=A0A841CSF4_9PSEU|nr:acetyl-CoA carboxylase biotin carboxyl carrier protein subunit [Saccharothrix tamanrassetensis]MBB5959793.1 acetyl-CoA carboxylase biotin carboxyl carrier protein [Saccharothrix tamanrassetensis]